MKNASSLSVKIIDLPPFRVASLDFIPQSGEQDTFSAIGAAFERVKEWVRSCGLDPATLLTIGVPQVVGDRLMKYSCCCEVPEEITGGVDEVEIKTLPGGRYAVLEIPKKSDRIGATIGRFYAEYVPEHQLNIEMQRPTYERYYEQTMEYCVPIR